MISWTFVLSSNVSLIDAEYLRFTISCILFLLAMCQPSKFSDREKLIQSFLKSRHVLHNLLKKATIKLSCNTLPKLLLNCQTL